MAIEIIKRYYNEKNIVKQREGQINSLFNLGYNVRETLRLSSALVNTVK